MSDLMVMDGFGEFEGLLRDVLRERVAVTEPAGFAQRLRAHLAQEREVIELAERKPRVFAFAESVKTQRSAASTWFAVGAHAAVLLLVLVAARQVKTGLPVKMVAQQVKLDAPVPAPKIPPALTAAAGGGGAHDLAPVAQGRLPKFAQQTLSPPKVPVDAKLQVAPTVMVQDLQMANNAMPNIGMPNSSLHGVSMGNGNGGGLGSGSGNGIGPGAGGNIGGGVMHVGGMVKAPVAINAPEPEFSEEARKAKFSGNVEVYLWVDEKGVPSHIRVSRGVGMGLDEKAVEAVRQYRFKPAMRDGKPVAVDLYIDVDFSIF